MEASRDFISEIADSFPQVKTISISRSLQYCSGGKAWARAETAAWIAEEFGDRFAVHLLGFYDSWHYELGLCQGTVRSIDTVAPFTAAYWGQLLSDKPGGLRRPRDYESVRSMQFPADLVRQNIEYLDSLAEGESQ
jgi:hypothetical protein